eukprot:3608473-Rhodomonas_salina.1
MKRVLYLRNDADSTSGTEGGRRGTRKSRVEVEGGKAIAGGREGLLHGLVALGSCFAQLLGGEMDDAVRHRISPFFHEHHFPLPERGCQPLRHDEGAV